MVSKNKKLNSILKRKNLINKLFKKNKIADMIIHSLNSSLSYETPGNEILKSAPPNHEFLKIIDINNEYTKIIIKGFRFYKKKSRLPAFAAVSNKLIKNLDPILENCSGETFSFSIVYQKSIDSFVMSRSNNNNTFNRIGIFNSHKIIFNSWENEDVRFSKNAFSGIVEAKIDKFKNLENDIKLIVKTKTFDELYNNIWTVNHKRFDKEKLLKELPGTYKNQINILYSNPVPDKQLVNGEIFFTFERPLFVNKSSTQALGRCVQTMPMEEKKETTSAGANSNQSIKKYNNSLQSYCVYWNEKHNYFDVILSDKDDTTVWEFKYETQKEIVGNLFEIPSIIKNVDSKVPSNSLVGTFEMSKIQNIPFNVITYNELYKQINNKE